MICLIKWDSCLLWALLIIFMKMLFTWFLYTHTLFVYSWLCFMILFEPYCFECQILCIWYDSWKIYVLISCFEGSLTSFSKIILTSYYSSFGNVFTIKILSNLIYENPFLSLYGRMDGRLCLVSFIENLLSWAYEGW